MYCWNENGESLEFKYKNKLLKDLKRTQSKEIEVNSIAPSGETGVTKNGTNFNPNGYNKLYNKDDELWLDGDFRDSKLYDGKAYICDKDGILLNIEIWRKGKFIEYGNL
ncbi:MAG: hypothetical protein ABJG68_16390 [Crocinitomicaceae bacterium]